MEATTVGEVTTVSEGGYTASSNTQNAEQIKSSLTEGTSAEPGDISKAASELGKKGGEASAAKRAEAAKVTEKPKEAAPEPVSGAETPEQAAESKKAGNPRHDPQARVAQATREAKEAREALAAERAERTRLAAELERARTQPQPPPKPQNGKPNPKDFESYEQYLDARDDHNRRQWDAQNARQQQAHQYEERLGGHVSEFSKHVAEARKSDPDFSDKVSPEILELRPSFTLPDGISPNGGTWIADELVFSPETAPALMLHFTEQPDEFQRIASLSNPRAVTREMAKLTSKIVSAKEAATTATSPRPEFSKAKPPVRPVAGMPHTVDAEPGENASYEEHKRFWSRKDKAASQR